MCVIVFRLNSQAQSKAHISKLKPKPMYTDEDVQKVMQIGYTKAVSIYALEACDGDINKACAMLLEFGLVLHQHY